MKIELGTPVKDKVSGFKGITIARTDYLNGCTRIGVQPGVDKEGKLPDAQWFDEPQLEVTGKKKIEIGARDTGGPCPAVPRRAANPKR